MNTTSKMISVGVGIATLIAAVVAITLASNEYARAEDRALREDVTALQGSVLAVKNDVLAVKNDVLALQTELLADRRNRVIFEDDVRRLLAEILDDRNNRDASSAQTEAPAEKEDQEERP